MLHYLNQLYIRIILGGCFAFLAVTAVGQTPVVTNQAIEVTVNKTSSIVFPAGITSVDRGSQDILAQKAKRVENVLQVKASRRSIPETNLTIITSDGIVHHFTVNYSDRPKTQTVLAPLAAEFWSSNSEWQLLFSSGVNLAELSKISDLVLSDRSRRTIESDKKFDMKLLLKEPLVRGDLFFFHIQVKNTSNINFDIKSLRFYIRDRKKAKRTAIQEIEMLPLFVQDEARKVKGKSTVNVVYAFRKFTIPDAKVLEIDLFEENGGRDLKLRVFNRKIVKAKAIPTK